MHVLENLNTETLRRQALFSEEEYAITLINYFKNIVPLPFNAILTFSLINGTILRLQQKIMVLCLLQTGFNFPE